MDNFTLPAGFERCPPPDKAQPPQWNEAKEPPPHEVASRRNEPLFDLEEASVAEFLAKPPPARRWILKDLLPQNIVGILAGGGGAGKSMLMLQLAIAITTGRPFLGVEIGEPGSVLILAAEDDREELHRRLFAIIDRMRQDAELDGDHEKRICERLFIKSRVGDDNHMTAINQGTIIRTDFGERVAETVEAIPELKLVVLDPVSRFRGEENSNDHATYFVEAVEALRKRLGTTVLLVHHVSKDGLRAGADKLGAESLRGASALLDGVRWVAAIATLRRDDAGAYGVNRDDAGNYVRLDVVKSNYAPPWAGMWLHREAGGVLVKSSLSRVSKAEDKAEKKYQEVLRKIIGVVRKAQKEGAPMTKQKLRDMAGVHGIFGVGEHALRTMIERAKEEGALFDLPNRTLGAA